MQKNLYICTAYNDIQYILYHIVSNNNQAVIVVFSHQNLYEFLLNLKHKKILEVKYFEFSLYNIYKSLALFKELKLISTLRKYAQGYNNFNVYTISLYFDLKSLFFLNKLSDRNNIFLFCSSDLISNFIPVKNDLKTKVLSLLYQTTFQKYNTYNTHTYGLSNSFISKKVNKYYIKNHPFSSDKMNIFKIQPNIQGNFILFILSNEEEKLLGAQNLDNILSTIIMNNSELKVCFKGHPRLGAPLFFIGKNYFQFDLNFPIEFFDFVNCKMIIGLSSVALANIANMNIKSYSLINFLPEENFQYKSSSIEYLNSHSNKISFPTNFNQFI